MTLSHDGSKLAYTLTDPLARNSDIWIYQFASGASTRFTFASSLETGPVWSPHDDSLAYSTNESARALNIAVMAANGAGVPRVVVTSPRDKQVTDWSLDGSLLLFQSLADAKTKDYKFSSIILGIANSTPFQMRRSQ